MSLREKFGALSGKAQLAISLGVLMIAAVLVWSSFGVSSGSDRSFAKGGAKRFFTIDGGATWFVDDAGLVPPFQHDGKEADEVIVFASEGGGKPVAGYLQRFNTAAKKKLDAKQDLPRTPVNMEVRKPGPAGTWVNANSPAAFEVIHGATAGGKASRVDP